METELTVNIKNLSKKYDVYNKPIDRLKESLSMKKKILHNEFYALRNIGFEIYKGETVGIIGKNGSGKSTLLKIITGVLSKTQGEVTVNGKISALLELGAGFNPEYTGIENIYLNGSMVGFSKEEIEKKIPSIVEFADIGDFVYRPIKTYSSGMFARLAFAVAINIEPDILIVDEALSVGDMFFQTKCYKKFEEFKKKGKTILFVTHDMGSIIKYCDRAIVLHEGCLIEEGKPAEMVDVYKKIISNQYNDNNIIKEKEAEEYIDTKQNWKEKVEINKKLLEYGTKKGEIIDYAIFNNKGQISNIISKDELFTVRMKIKFNQKINNPIFAYTIKDIKGTEITGTNTWFEDKMVTVGKCGEVYDVKFTQKTVLQNGSYLISLGCTAYEGEVLEVHHRLYDVLSLHILSEKITVGYFDPYSEVVVRKLGDTIENR